MSVNAAAGGHDEVGRVLPSDTRFKHCHDWPNHENTNTHRLRVAPVLAADAKGHAAARDGAALADGGLHELAHAVAVKCLKGVLVQHLVWRLCCGVCTCVVDDPSHRLWLLVMQFTQCRTLFSR